VDLKKYNESYIYDFDKDYHEDFDKSLNKTIQKFDKSKGLNNIDQLFAIY
jgi:hypothetical protein